MYFGIDPNKDPKLNESTETVINPKVRKKEIRFYIMVGIAVLVFIIFVIFLIRVLFFRSKKESYKSDITTNEVISIMKEFNLIDYNLNGKINEKNVDDLHTFISQEKNYQIIYSKFKNQSESNKNFTNNQLIINNNFNNSTIIDSIDKNGFSKYIIEKDNYFAAELKIGTNFFEVKTVSNNKDEILNIIAKLEKK